MIASSADVLGQVTVSVRASAHPSLSTHPWGELALPGLGSGAPQEGRRWQLTHVGLAAGTGALTCC